MVQFEVEPRSEEYFKKAKKGLAGFGEFLFGWGVIFVMASPSALLFSAGSGKIFC